ncbi:MAG: Secretin XcpQ [Chlamydiales bacterium]|nr:Secretin XcpQ [Chlamydiales bacterium]MCH9619671.1 Secretin XcpQ [Chlamydiales bacterium]MCH9623277.1 Secretin XcpQ [Chlamydiales bacterium]
MRFGSVLTVLACFLLPLCGEEEEISMTSFCPEDQCLEQQMSSGAGKKHTGPFFKMPGDRHLDGKISPSKPKEVVAPHLFSTPYQDRERASSETELPDGTKIFHIEKGENVYKIANCNPDGEGFTVNFEDISIIEFLQFVSEISGANFIFESEALQFNITVVSQEAASVTDLTSALIQILKMHNLSVVEQGNTVLIYSQQNLSKVSKVITDDNIQEACGAAVVTRVFRLFNVEPTKIAAIVKPLLSPDATVDVSLETRHLIVSDITSNVDKIAQLLNALDTPNAAFDIAEYTVKGAYPAALVAYTKEILGPLIQENPIQIIAQPSQHKIFLVSTPYLIHKALQVMASLDTADITDVGDLPAHAMANNTIYMYKLKYHQGSDIASALHSIGNNLQYAGLTNLELVNAISSIEYVEVNNSLVVTGSGEAVKKVVGLLDELDQAPKQVYLEVLIIDTTLNNSLDFGIQWVALGDEQDKLAYASGLLSQSPPGPELQGSTTTNPGARFVSGQGNPPPVIPNPGRDVALPEPSSLQGFNDLLDSTEAFGFGIIGNIIRHKGESFLTLGALVSALEQESHTKIVLNPKILAQDTQTADVLVGQNIPYQTTNTVIQQTGSVTQNIQYEDIGVHLRVTPNIAPNNVVSIQMDQSVTELVSAVGTLTPTTTKTNTSTRVHVPDGCFVVMSGHVRDKTTSIRSGVPCLGTLPLIGPTFSRNIEQREKRNLIIFMRPKVMTTIGDVLQITNQEGYDYNWEIDPKSIQQCGSSQAPECEVYPARTCPIP